MKRIHISYRTLLTGVAAFVVVTTIAGAYVAGKHTASDTQAVANTGGYGAHDDVAALPAASQQRIDEGVAKAAESTQTQTVNERLLYLIEEEKLAHDVYQKMDELYGARTFSNISRSETMHQNLVNTVLVSRGLTNPRSDLAGVFQNQDLQRLYDTLVARGSQGLTEAYAVGVTIEEVDIADLTATISRVDPADTDVLTMLETLKHGSENHLRAFSRHV